MTIVGCFYQFFSLRFVKKKIQTRHVHHVDIDFSPLGDSANIVESLIYDTECFSQSVLFNLDFW